MFRPDVDVQTRGIREWDAGGLRRVRIMSARSAQLGCEGPVWWW